MLRILVAAIVLLAAAYVFLNQDAEDARVLETQQQALDEAKAVEKTVQDQAEALRKQIDEQTSGATNRGTIRGGGVQKAVLAVGVDRTRHGG